MVTRNYFKRVLGILAASAVLISLAYAEDQSPKVAVMPFVIHSQKDQTAIQKSVEELLTRQIAAEGMRVVDPAEVHKNLRAGEAVQTEEEARAVGRKVQADFVVLGSFNVIGTSNSLDAKLVDVSGRKKTENLFAEEKGIENPAGAAIRIVQQIAVNVMAKALIADIKVRGNDRIEADAIKSVLKSKKGEILRPDDLREDIRSIYKMGYFENVDAEVSDSPAGKVLTFVVQENPTIQEVKIAGNKKIKEKDILAAIGVKPYTILQQNVVSDDVQKIVKLYQQKGYFGADITSSVTFPKDPRRAVVTFNIKENNKIWIKKITFRGNQHMSARTLRGVMQTKQKMFLISLVSERGILQKEVLDTDVDRLTVMYHDEGYMDAKVGIPEITKKDDGFYIEIPVEEGQRYKVTGVKVAGDLFDNNAKIEKGLDSKPKDYFSREKVRHDMDYLSKTYMDKGFAHAEVSPLITRNPDDKTSDITYEAKKNEEVHIGRIFITGNTKTRDNVIRRELKIYEGDLYSSSKIEASLGRLKKLDYFEDVEIVPVETEQPGIMNLHVKVKEKLTGSISLGGGYSSDDGLFTSAQIMQRNLFGKGESVSVRAYLGQAAQRYIFSFTEPWMFGYPVAGGLDVYNWLRDYDQFTEESVGFRLRVGKPFGLHSRVFAYYTFEQDRVSDVSSDASSYIVSQADLGWTTLSSITVGAERDTTDHPFLPTRGTINTVTAEYSSPYFGSESNFLRAEFHSGAYFPLGVWKFIGFVKGEVGIIDHLDDSSDLPIYERYFLGGINNLRGWQWGDVGPRDSDGDIIGGEKYGVATAELLFPLYEKMGIRGVVFMDAGNAFRGSSSFDVTNFRTDAGAGVRWNSPFGPLRIEIGIPLDRQSGDDSYQWQFSAGAYF